MMLDISGVQSPEKKCFMNAINTSLGVEPVIGLSLPVETWLSLSKIPSSPT